MSFFLYNSNRLNEENHPVSADNSPKKVSWRRYGRKHKTISI